MLIPINSIGFDRVFRPLDAADPSYLGRRFKAAEPPCIDKPVGAVQEGCCCGALARGSGSLGHDELSLLGGAGSRCSMGWAFERLGCSSGGVGHFWGAFASVDRPGGA